MEAGGGGAGDGQCRAEGVEAEVGVVVESAYVYAGGDIGPVLVVFTYFFSPTVERLSGMRRVISPSFTYRYMYS